MRRNILEWYPFKKDAKVLEIDAECGAVTGCIADKVLQVTSLENNDLQRQINECRNSKKKISECLQEHMTKWKMS